MKVLIWAVMLGITLCGCSSGLLTVYTDYLSHENLASYQVGTPDPRLDNPPIGQRLLISWSIPKCEFADAHIDYKIRFRNRKEISSTIPVISCSGTYIYSLLNEEYFETEGILTYKVDLYIGDQLIEEWRHQLWVEMLVFD